MKDKETHAVLLHVPWSVHLQCTDIPDIFSAYVNAVIDIGHSKVWGPLRNLLVFHENMKTGFFDESKV